MSEAQPDEEWKPVVGWEGLYEVSSHGRVRSLEREVDNPLTGGVSVRGGRVLTPYKHPTGYLRVALSGGGRVKRAPVHRLVCTAFHGTPPVGKEFALHGDGVKDNNRKENLRWGSDSDNTLDSVRHGTHHLARRTECKRGQEFLRENTYYTPSGFRNCKICTRDTAKERRSRPLPAGDPAHGSNYGYVGRSCRCLECKAARAEYVRSRKNADIN